MHPGFQRVRAIEHFTTRHAELKNRWSYQTLILLLVRSYFLHFPIDRGKVRLRQWIEPTLRRAGKIPISLDRNTTILVDINEPLQRSIFYHGVYEKEERLFRFLLSEGMTVFDVGANVGLYALLAASRVGIRGQVHAFEPAPDNFLSLEENVRRNHFTNVTVNHAAVSDACTSARLYLSPPGNCGKHSMFPTNKQRDSIEVPCVSIKTYMKKKKLQKVDLLKIDVEGAEMLVLNGTAQLLSSPCSPIVFCEVSDELAAPFGYSSRDAKGLLRSHGYKIYRYGCERLIPVTSDESHYCENLVFVKPEHFDRFAVLRGMIDE